MSSYSTTEISSGSIRSDNPIHQRLLFPYQQVAPQLTGSVLELGCGWGRGLDVLLQQVGHYTGVDKNRRLINQLQATYQQASFIAATLPSLHFLPDNAFDYVLSFQVIEHILDDEHFVAEAWRVLKPGGRLFITTINKVFSLTRNPWHVREYDASDLAARLARRFPIVIAQGIQGNDLVQTYACQQARSVQQFMRFDVLGLQYRLPGWLLRWPYEMLNRYNRNRLLGSVEHAGSITVNDFFISEDPAASPDLFYSAIK